MKIPTAKELDNFVNKNISEICGCLFFDNAENHCAHFVCHLTELNSGYTCYNLKKKGDKAKSANIKVQEVFPLCRRVGKWADKPKDILQGFIFVTQADNVNLEKKTIENVRRKHIGIFIGESVWQYKNAYKHVIKQSPAAFRDHYAGKGYEVFFGEFPL